MGAALGILSMVLTCVKHRYREDNEETMVAADDVSSPNYSPYRKFSIDSLENSFLYATGDEGKNGQNKVNAQATDAVHKFKLAKLINYILVACFFAWTALVDFWRFDHLGSVCCGDYDEHASKMAGFKVYDQKTYEKIYLNVDGTVFFIVAYLSGIVWVLFCSGIFLVYCTRMNDEEGLRDTQSPEKHHELDDA